MTPSRPKVAPRVAWIAGTRGEILLLTPLMRGLRETGDVETSHSLLTTGEHGMAASQALDRVGVIPDETSPVCHPADEPALRLREMLERVEAFLRRRKITHAVFAGSGPTAAAAALMTHARNARGLWLTPPDPVRLAPRLRWEAGLTRVARACAPCVEPYVLEAMPEWLTESNAATAPLMEQDALRDDAPLVVVALVRREWGMRDTTPRRLFAALARSASQRPECDWWVVGNLNARMEGPLRALKPWPPNLLATAPLPWGVWRTAMTRARAVLTDSPLIAADARHHDCRVAALGETPPPTVEAAAPPPNVLSITPDDLDVPRWDAVVDTLLKKPPVTEGDPTLEIGEVVARVAGWLARP